jgi:enoyl-CoA hydratase
VTAGGVQLQFDGDIATITIDRPEKRNAIGLATAEELDGALDDVGSSTAAVLVLRGGGDRAFVSGGDLKELASVRSHEGATVMAGRMRAVLDKMADLPLPVIAALNGHALGGGAETAIAADIRIAADDIRIGFTQVALGIMPAWGGAERLAQVIGRGRAMIAIATGEVYQAKAAAEIGLVDVVVPRAAFDHAVNALATRIAMQVPGTSRRIKSVLAAAEPHARPDLAPAAIDHFATLWTSDSHWEAVDRSGR